MNKKAITPLTVVFWFIMFIIIFFMFGASFMSTQGHLAVTQNGLTGIEALVFDNIMIIYLGVVVLALIGYIYMTGQN